MMAASLRGNCAGAGRRCKRRRIDPALLVPAAGLSPDDVEVWITLAANAAVLAYQDGAWAFAHDKLREILLADLAPDERRTLSGQAAAALRLLHGDDPQWAGALAEHYTAADDPDQAAYFARIAARHAFETSAYGPALAFAARALAHLPDDGPLLKLMGDIHIYSGDYEGALAFYSRVADGPHDPGARAAALAELGRVHYYRNERPQARVALREALELAHDAADQRTIARALNNLGLIDMLDGRNAAARAAFGQSLALRRALGDARGVAMSLLNLGIVLWNEGDNPGAAAHYLEAHAITQQIGDRWGAATSLANVARVYLLRDEAEAARIALRDALALALEADALGLVLDVLAGYAWLCLLEGRAEYGALLMGVVYAHPATEALVIEEFEQMAGFGFVAALSTDGLQATLARGKTLPLAQFLAEARADLAP
jgi:tetratricopeptide (TPR) repeat protein